jgi:glycosyltransferase involved in cell wall biosynthesis
VTATGALAPAAASVPAAGERDHHSSADPGSRGRMPRVAYVMSRFPKVSETFIANEIVAVERAGVDVEIHPLIRERAQIVQPAAGALVGRTRYVRPFSASVGAALLYFLVRRPTAVVGAVSALVRDTWRRPATLLRSLALFPVIVAHARAMRDEGVEHVHCHFATYPAFAGFAIRRLTGIPYSFTAHAHDIQLEAAMLPRKVAEAAFVVAISRENRRRIVEVCGPAAAAKVRVIHCGVDTVRFSPASSQPTAGRHFTILSVGRLLPVKGHAFLVAACQRLAAAGVAFRCQIVGDGPLREELRRQIAAARLADDVELLGARSSDEVQALMASADAVVLPSVPTPDGREEGIPIVLMEAMSSGLAVVASRTGGIPELVEDGEGGLLVEPGDAEGLAEALRGLASDAAARAMIGRAARARVLEAFDLDEQAEQLAREFALAFEARDAIGRSKVAAALSAR